MQKFKFLQAALIGRGGLAGGHTHTYTVGVHEVSAEHQEDPTFKHFLKHKLILTHKKHEPTELPAAKSDMAKISADAAKASQMSPDQEIGGEAEPDFGDEDKAEKPHHKGKHGKHKEK